MEFYGGKQQDDNGDILESNEIRCFEVSKSSWDPTVSSKLNLSRETGKPMVPMPPPNFAKHPLLSVASPMKIRVFQKPTKIFLEMIFRVFKFSTNKDMRMQKKSQGWAMNGYPPAGAWLENHSHPFGSIWCDEFPSSHV